MPRKDNLTAHPASRYDDHVRESIPYYDAFHDEAINLMAVYLPNPGLWVDTGCGTGTLIAKAYSRFPDTRFILADPSPAMLELARLKLEGKDRATILSPRETKDLDISEQPDVITAIQAHHYMRPDLRRESTQKCFDLLKSDGIFITFENVRALTETGTKIGKEYWKGYQEKAGKNKRGSTEAYREIRKRIPSHHR